jgi:hypothetical protein
MYVYFIFIHMCVCVRALIKDSSSTLGYPKEGVPKLFLKCLYQIDHLTTGSGN